jgi:hypothetical protein
MLVGLGSLALYGAAAALALWLAHRFVLPLRLGPAFLLAAAPLLLTGKAFVTGGVYAPVDILYDGDPFQARRAALGLPPDRTPSLSDVVYQEIPWRAAVRASLGRRELPLWNPYLLAGEPLMAMQQPVVLHPATWLSLLLPLPQSWTFEMGLRLFLAMLCGYLFFLDLCASEVAALLGAVAWALSDYFVFFLGYPLSPAVAPLPLLLLGLRWLARRPGRRAFGVIVAALCLILTSGHPETLLHVTAGAGLYFLFELSGATARRKGRSLGLALSAGALALGLTAVLLLPLAEALPLTEQHSMRSAWYSKQKRSEPLSAVLGRMPPQAVPYAVGVAGKGGPMPGFIEPSSYAGVLLFPLAAVGLFSRRRCRWFFAALGLLGFSVCARTPTADLLAKLPLFDIAINERLIVLVAFAICALAVLGAARLRQGEGARAFLIAAAATLGGVVWLFMHFRAQMLGLGMPANFLRERLLLQVVPLAAGIALVAVRARGHRVVAAVPVLVALLAAERALEAGGVYPTLPAKIFYPEVPVLQRIPRGEPYRFAAVGWVFIPNFASLYGIEDVRGYEAMNFLPLSQTFSFWCVPQGPWFNRVDDPTRPFLSFLNVRWVLTPQGFPPPAGWPVLAEGDHVRLLENPRALPRAFIPRFLRAEPDPLRRLALLGDIRDFAERGVIAEDTGGDWVENGQAQATVEAYAPQAMAIRVAAKATTLVGTSVTNWPGWKATLDGSPVSPVPFNNAFLAFRVPPGSHRLALRYAPNSVVYGAAISLAAAILSAFLLLRPRRPTTQSGSATTTV